MSKPAISDMCKKVIRGIGLLLDMSLVQSKSINRERLPPKLSAIRVSFGLCDRIGLVRLLDAVGELRGTIRCKNNYFLQIVSRL